MAAPVEVYPCYVWRNERWEHIGTYYNRGVADFAIAAIRKSKAKKWHGVEKVKICTRPWVVETDAAEWLRVVQP